MTTQLPPQAPRHEQQPDGRRARPPQVPPQGPPRIPAQRAPAGPVPPPYAPLPAPQRVPQPTPQRAPQPGAGRGLAAAGAVLGVVGLVGLLGCIVWAIATAGGTTPAPAGPPVPAAAPSLVRYEVTGTGRAVVSYTDEKGAMGRQTSLRLPWTKEIRSDSSFPFYSVTVTNAGGAGTVECRIVHNGTVVSQQNATGPNASASCSG